MVRTWLATIGYGSRAAGHLPYPVTTQKPRRTRRPAAASLPGRCELDDDVEIAAPLNTLARAVNRTSKAYRVGYADGVATAREENGELAFSAQQAGSADEALLNAVGSSEMARILGVREPVAGGPRTTTLEFRSACDDYNAGYAVGWETAEIAALERGAQL